jgi:hypothetical protein
MSSPDQAPPPVPDDDHRSPEPDPPGPTPHTSTPGADVGEEYLPNPTLDELVRTELVRQTQAIAAEACLIAQAQARQAELLVDLQAWSEDPQVASRLHGSSVTGTRRC